MEESVLPFVADSEKAGILAEGITISLCRRKYRCFYIKAEKEVDLAYIRDGKASRRSPAIVAAELLSSFRDFSAPEKFIH
jgi:hypothetical protein